MREPAIDVDDANGAARVERGWAHLLYNQGKLSLAVDVDDPSVWQAVEAMLPRFDVLIAPLTATGALAEWLSRGAAGEWAHEIPVVDCVFRRSDAYGGALGRGGGTRRRSDRDGGGGACGAEWAARRSARLAGRQSGLQAGVDYGGGSGAGVDHAAAARGRLQPRRGRDAGGGDLHHPADRQRQLLPLARTLRPTATPRSARWPPSRAPTDTGSASRFTRPTGRASSIGPTMCWARNRCAIRNSTMRPTATRTAPKFALGLSGCARR